MKVLAQGIFAMILQLVATASCAESTLTKFNLISQHPNSYQDKWIVVRGFVAIDELKNTYLFLTSQEATSKEFEKSIDLIALPEAENEIKLLVDGACAEIYGKFNAYGKKYIPSGYLQSRSGLINVKRISSCAN